MMENNLQEFLTRFRFNKREFLNNAGEFGKSKMDHHVAVDTGYLKSRNDFNTNGVDVLQFINDTSYAGYQELGTYKMRAHPFVRPCVFNYIPKYQQLSKELGRGL